MAWRLSFLDVRRNGEAFQPEDITGSSTGGCECMVSAIDSVIVLRGADLTNFSTLAFANSDFEEEHHWYSIFVYWRLRFVLVLSYALILR